MTAFTDFYRASAVRHIVFYGRNYGSVYALNQLNVNQNNHAGDKFERPSLQARGGAPSSL